MDDISKLHQTGYNSRWWVFTINNYTDNDYKQLDLLCTDPVIYLTYGHEVGKENNTPHLQGYLELSKPQKFSWIKKRLKRAYIASRKGSRTQARDYCHKECNEPYEYGKWIPDRQGMRNELTQCKNLIDDGFGLDYLWENHFSTMVRYSRAMQQYQLVVAKKNRKNEPIECIWIYGESGSGKSRYAHETWPDAYVKSNNKWWDGYCQEETVIWDDFSKTPDYKYQDLLKWCDRYKKQGETKGGTTPLFYKRIVFTSIAPPEYYGFDQQLIRRFGDGANITPVTSLQEQKNGTI